MSRDMRSTDDPNIQFLSRYRCDGLVSSEDVARLKQELRGGFEPRATRAVALGMAQITPYTTLHFA